MNQLFSVGVVAHRKRRERAERLAEVTNATIVAIDEGGVGAGFNHEVCYRWLAQEGSSWSVILEDDACPVIGFTEQLTAVLSCAPSPLVSLYLGRSRPPHAQIPIARVIAADHHYLMCDELLHHVAVAVRTELIGGILDHLAASAAYQAGQLPIDEAVGQAARERGHPISYSQPSLVDHAQIPTLIEHHPSGHHADRGKRPLNPRHPRRAWTFGTRPHWDRERTGRIELTNLPGPPPQTRKNRNTAARSG